MSTQESNSGTRPDLPPLTVDFCEDTNNKGGVAYYVSSQGTLGYGTAHSKAVTGLAAATFINGSRWNETALSQLARIAFQNSEVVGKRCPEFQLTTQCPENPISFVKHQSLDTARTASRKQGNPMCGYVDKHGESLSHGKWSMAPQLWFGVSASDLDSEGKVLPAVYDNVGGEPEDVLFPGGDEPTGLGSGGGWAKVY